MNNTPPHHGLQPQAGGTVMRAPRLKPGRSGRCEHESRDSTISHPDAVLVKASAIEGLGLFAGRRFQERSACGFWAPREPFMAVRP